MLFLTFFFEIYISVFEKNVQIPCLECYIHITYNINTRKQSSKQHTIHKNVIRSEHKNALTAESYIGILYLYSG